jgi:hypothetical protein
VKPLRTTTLRLGPPFTIKSKVRKKGSFIEIDYAIVGQAGERYEALAVKDNRVVRKAKVRIMDETGNIFEAGSFKYG